MPYVYQRSEITPVVHIEVQPSGSATMTFKNSPFEGNVMRFKHTRDAVHHATHNGFEQITRASHPEYFVQPSEDLVLLASFEDDFMPTQDPAYGLYAAFDGDFDHGCYKD